MLQSVFDWLTALPPAALYAALALFAAAENVFPPLPADSVVAFGAFLAARGDASLAGAFLATWLGNVTGAMLMYALGVRFGAERLHQRFPALVARDGAASRVTELYVRYGVAALFVSRFLPGVRAVVPPMAGALRVPPVTTAIAIALASAIWYGGIAVLAYRVGAHWDALTERIASLGRWAGVAAVVVVAAAAAVVYARRRRRR